MSIFVSSNFRGLPLPLPLAAERTAKVSSRTIGASVENSSNDLYLDGEAGRAVKGTASAMLIERHKEARAYGRVSGGSRDRE